MGLTIPALPVHNAPAMLHVVRGLPQHHHTTIVVVSHTAGRHERLFQPALQRQPLGTLSPQQKLPGFLRAFWPDSAH
ncbi:hypothetical protein D3C73_1523700 [compost metagenome]